LERQHAVAKLEPDPVAAIGEPGSRLDGFDRTILRMVQARGDIGPAELSGQVHLSPSQCSRRLQRLRAEGYVQKVVGLLEPEKLNLGIAACLLIKLKSHTPEAEKSFAERVLSLSEIISANYLTGESDFILQVWTKDLKSYANFLSDRLLPGLEIESVHSSFILRPIKSSTELPLDFC
jgi:Lrp/AsnC family transcriptional regulator, leucine-responsive regulatory protein